MAEFPNEQHDDQNEHPSAPLPISDDRYYGAPRVYDDDYPGNKVADFIIGFVLYPIATACCTIMLIQLTSNIYDKIRWVFPIGILILTIWLIRDSFKIGRRFIGIGMIAIAPLLLLVAGACGFIA